MSQYSQIPPHMMQAMVHYVVTGDVSSDFLKAVIDNNIKGAVGYADDSNCKILYIYVTWFYNRAPALCWGSTVNREAWIARGGMPEWQDGL